jgi:hypothetical protein
MIHDADQLVLHIAKWIGDYTSKYGLKKLVVGFDGSRNSAIVLHCACKTTELIGGKIGVMPVFNTQSEHILKHTYPSGNNIIAKDNFTVIELSNIAEANQGVVLGLIDRTQGLYSRSYRKTSALLTDILPIYELYYSEIRDLSEKLWPGLWTDKFNERIYTQDWCIEFQSGMIVSEQLPHLSQNWFTFNKIQKEEIAMMHAREKATRHKTLTKPFCPIRDNTSLVG